MSLKMSSHRVLILTIVLASLVSVPRGWGSSVGEDLRLLYQQEVSDHARSLAFARQAELEGSGEVASLFRAIARADDIHAQTILKMIYQLGGNVHPASEGVISGNTEGNLQTAIGNEERECRRVYPAVIHRAKQAGLRKMAERLERIKGAKVQHEILFRRSQSSARQPGSSEERYFYVCPDCGYVTEEILFQKCPNCFAPDVRFEMVS